MCPIHAITDLRLAFGLAVFLFAGPAGAQPLDLSARQEATFRDYAARAAALPGTEQLAVGRILPFGIDLHRMPTSVMVELPGARGYRFVTGTAGIAIVDPADRRIVQVLPPR
jgi:hypothetical protein